jgi:hypothetical protein
MSEPASAKENAPAPPAAFTAATTNPAAKAPVQFTGGSEGAAMTWHWDSATAARRPRQTLFIPSRARGFPRDIDGHDSPWIRDVSQVMAVTGCETRGSSPSHPFDVTLSATDLRTGKTAGSGRFAERYLRIFSIPTSPETRATRRSS